MRVVSLATGTGNPTESRNLGAEILNAGAARDPLPEEPWTRDPTCLPSFTRPCSGSQQCQGLAEASFDRVPPGIRRATFESLTATGPGPALSRRPRSRRYRKPAG